MNFLADDVLRQAVEPQDRTFDTHDVIHQVIRLFPQEYVRELFRYVDTDDPFKPVHGQIGQRLATLNSIEQRGKTTSLNIRGVESVCESWRRTG